MAEKYKAKDRIVLAISELLKKKSMQAVSVSDIIEAAKVSRTTFYRLFTDKWDLIQRICYQDIETITAVPKEKIWTEGVILIFDAVKERALFYRRLFPDDEGQQAFENAFDQFHRKYSNVPANPYAVAAWSRAMKRWIANNFEDDVGKITQELLENQPLTEILGREELGRAKAAFMKKKPDESV